MAKTAKCLRVHLDPEDDEAIRILAIKMKTRPTAIVRQLVRGFLRPDQPPAPKSNPLNPERKVDHE